MKTTARSKRLIAFAVIMLLVLGTSLTFCCQTAAAAGISSFKDLEDKRIGVTTGSVQALQTEELFPNADLYYFATSVDMLNALRAKKKFSEMMKNAAVFLLVGYLPVVLLTTYIEPASMMLPRLLGLA